MAIPQGNRHELAKMDAGGRHACTQILRRLTGIEFEANGQPGVQRGAPIPLLKGSQTNL